MGTKQRSADTYESGLADADGGWWMLPWRWSTRAVVERRNLCDWLAFAPVA